MTAPNVEKSSDDADDFGTLISAHSHTSRTHTVETTTVSVMEIGLYDVSVSVSARLGICNSIPSLTAFKSGLKTHLTDLACNS